MKKQYLYLSVLLVAISTECFSYEQPTHEVLSEYAARQSVIFKDPSFMRLLGLPHLTSNNAQLRTSLINPNQTASIVDLIRDGAEFEDNGIRSLNHFYNPLDGSPLSVASIFGAESSLDWAAHVKIVVA